MQPALRIRTATIQAHGGPVMPKQLGALPGMYRDHLVLLREPLAGLTMQTLPGTLRHLAAWFSSGQAHEPAL
jgi:hypothetical protein